MKCEFRMSPSAIPMKPKLPRVFRLVPGIALLSFASGCVSSSLPPRPTPEQRTAIQETRFDLTVGVEQFRNIAYPDSLIEALARTNLFVRVDRLENFATPPDLVARLTQYVPGAAVIPLMTGLSLGIIPTIVDEGHGYIFSLGLPDVESPEVPIRFEYSGPTTLGWLALFENLSRSRTVGDVTNHPRFTEALSWQIVAQREAIVSMLAANPAP